MARTLQLTALGKSLTMVYDMRMSGTKVKVLLDTGDEESFIPASTVAKLGLTVIPLPTQHQVQLSSELSLALTGTVAAKLNCQRLCTTVRLYVVDGALPFDLILGNPWLTYNNAILHVSSGLCSLGTGRKRCKIEALAAEVSAEVSADDRVQNNIPVLTALQFKRAAQHTDRVLLAVVHKDDLFDDPPANRLVDADLQSLLDEFADLFPSKLLSGLPPVRAAAHTIPLKDPESKPPYRPPFRATPAEREEMQKHLKDLTEAGLIEPSTSPYGSPVLFVPKKDGGLRMCIDYRALNKLTLSNGYPLPRIDDLLDQLQGSTIFTTMDLMSGYNQIRISEEDVPKTAFTTPFGHFQFKVLCFGLTNAPATFQSVMNRLFQPMLSKFVVIYIDDFIIYSKSRLEHFAHLRAVMEVLRRNQLYCKLPKCEFLRNKLVFLGHEVSADGIRADPGKTSAVNDWPTPRGEKEVRQFVGLANYFRRYVEGYAQLVSPLTDLLKKDVPFDWTVRCQAAFDGVKAKLTSSPCLVLPNPTDPFEVVSDASGVAVGGVLRQNKRPVAFESRKLTPAECNYDTGERELLGVCYLLRKWRCYLEGPEFTVITDHCPLTYLATQVAVPRKRVKYSEFLSQYKFKWQYKPGVTNPADPLSRHPLFLGVITRHQRAMARGITPAQPQVESRGLRTDTAEAITSTPSEWAEGSGSECPVDVSPGGEAMASRNPLSDQSVVEEEEPLTLIDAIRKASAEDPWLQSEDATIGCEQRDGIWYTARRQVLVPGIEGLREKILWECHDSMYSAHRGQHKTSELVQAQYFWPGWRRAVQDWVSSCDICQRSKIRRQMPAGLLSPLPVPDGCWQDISVDFITSLPLTSKGHDSVFVMVDRFSKLTHFVACRKDIDSIGTAGLFLQNWVRLHGIPASLLSDRDPRFTGAFFKELARLLHTQQRLSTAYHPQTDGQTERMNAVLEEILRCYAHTEIEWDVSLSMAEFAVNNSKQVCTQETPFMVAYGFCPRLPVTIGESAVPRASDYLQKMA